MMPNEKNSTKTLTIVGFVGVFLAVLVFSFGVPEGGCGGEAELTSSQNQKVQEAIRIGDTENSAETQVREVNPRCPEGETWQPGSEDGDATTGETLGFCAPARTCCYNKNNTCVSAENPEDCHQVKSGTPPDDKIHYCSFAETGDACAICEGTIVGCAISKKICNGDPPCVGGTWTEVPK
jgi:hypothetical protein